MPKRYWVLFVAALGITTNALGQEREYVWFNGVLLECDARQCVERLEQRINEPNKEDSAESNTREEPEAPKPFVLQFVTPERETEDTETQAKTQREIADLSAQRSMATWTRNAVMVGGASLLIAGFGVLLLRRQIRLTRQLFIADKRPWVEVILDKDESEIVKRFDAHSMVVRVQLRNHGHMPALQARVRGVQALPKYDESAMKQLADDARAGKGLPTDEDETKTVFPGGQPQTFSSISVSGADGRWTSVFLAGWAEYTFEGSEIGRHVTPFCWKIAFYRYDDEFTLGAWQQRSVSMNPT